MTHPRGHSRSLAKPGLLTPNLGPWSMLLSRHRSHRNRLIISSLDTNIHPLLLKPSCCEPAARLCGDQRDGSHGICNREPVLCSGRSRGFVAALRNLTDTSVSRSVIRGGYKQEQCLCPGRLAHPNAVVRDATQARAGYCDLHFQEGLAIMLKGAWFSEEHSTLWC